LDSLLSHLQSIVKPEVELKEIPLEVIAADMLMDSLHAVPEIEDVNMKSSEICSFSALFNIVNRAILQKHA
jgi:hypothetical protein